MDNSQIEELEKQLNAIEAMPIKNEFDTAHKNLKAKQLHACISKRITTTKNYRDELNKKLHEVRLPKLTF